MAEEGVFYLGEEKRRERRVFGRLDDAGAASGQGGGHLACDHGDGEVPLLGRVEEVSHCPNALLSSLISFKTHLYGLSLSSMG